jgi:hypothetical protein
VQQASPLPKISLVAGVTKPSSGNLSQIDSHWNSGLPEDCNPTVSKRNWNPYVLQVAPMTISGHNLEDRFCHWISRFHTRNLLGHDFFVISNHALPRQCRIELHSWHQSG